MEKKQNRQRKEDENGRLHRFTVLVAWYAEYLTINSYRPRTIKDYTYELSFFRRWLVENTDLDDIDDLAPPHLHDFAASLYNRSLATTSIHHKLAVVSTFLGALYDNKKLYTDLRGNVHLPRLPRRLPKDIMTEEEITKIFERLQEQVDRLDPSRPRQAVRIRDHAIFEVLYSSGLRKAELIHLCLDDVNYDDGLIVVREGKGGKDRVVPIGKKGLDAIRHYIRVARPTLVRRNTPYLFVSISGRYMDENAVLDSVKRTVMAAGIGRKVYAHAVRHCCATHMLNHGADIRYVQEFLGHACLASTQVYTHVSIGRLKETHRRFHPREQPDFMALPEEE